VNTVQEQTTEQLIEALVPVLRQQGVRLAILFGSWARGEATRDSDVDLILVVDTDKRFLDRYTPILHDLNRAVPGHPVEPWIYAPAEFERMRTESFVSEALREGLVIYEREQE
jgi:predicted nucleotidyltransferase